MTATRIPDVRRVSRLFKALSDETRLKIVSLLAHGELCVCHIQAALDLPQSNVSRQLAILRASGLVGDRRDGTWVHYRLLAQSDPECERHLGALARTFAADRALARLAAKLIKDCGPRSCC